MLRNYFQGQTIKESNHSRCIGLKRPDSLYIINDTGISSDKSILIQVNKSEKILPTSFNFSDFDGRLVVTGCGGIASFSLGLVALWKYLYLIESSLIHHFHMRMLKFLLIQMSTAHWYRVDFNFTALPLLAWIEVIIQVVNNLLRFILTIGFGVEYKFLNFHSEDSFIFLLNVS